MQWSRPNTTVNVSVNTDLKYSKSSCLVHVTSGGESFRGSGFWLVNDRCVVTAAHVVQGATKVVVDFPYIHRKVAAVVVESDKTNDVAVLRLNTIPPQLAAAGYWLAPTLPKPGDTVWMRGFGGIPTYGFQSVRGTVVEYKAFTPARDAYRELVVSVPIRQGDSGGVVVNVHGQVVGLITGCDGHTTVVASCYRQGFLGRMISRIRARKAARRGTINIYPPPQTDPMLPPNIPPVEEPGGEAPIVEPPIEPPATGAVIDYDKIIAMLKADPQFIQATKGETGDTGPEGPPGAPGTNGEDAVLTAEQIVEMTKSVTILLKSDPDFLASVKGEKGDDGVSPTAEEVAAILKTDPEFIAACKGEPGTPAPLPESEAAWSHLVLLASSEANYWPRLDRDFEEAKDYYGNLKHVEPPTDIDVGPLPLLVAYHDGKPVRSWKGLRDVSQAVVDIVRGDYDQFLHAVDHT